MKRSMTPVAAGSIDWQQDAACRGERAAFYPPLQGESKSERSAREQIAKSICEGCSVRSECLDHAIRHDERYGIWGGLTDSERRHLLRTA